MGALHPINQILMHFVDIFLAVVVGIVPTNLSTRSSTIKSLARIPCGHSS